MRSGALTVLLLALWVVPVLSAGAAPPEVEVATPALTDLVRELIAELDAPTRTRRLAAGKTLRELGPRILPLLPPPEVLVPAAREEIQTLQFELERRQARESVAPSPIKLSGKKSVRDWLTDMSRTSGNAWSPDSFSSAQLDAVRTLDLDTTWWQAIGELEPPDSRWQSRDGRLSLSTLPRPVTTCASGPFRVFAERLTRRSLSPTQDLLRWETSIETEPRLRPLFLLARMQDMLCQGEGVLPAWSPDGKFELPLAGTDRSDMRLDFVAPHGDLPKLSLAGKFEVVLAAGTEEIRFSDFDSVLTQKPKPIARRRGGVTVTLLRGELTSTGGARQLDMELSVTYDAGGPAFDSHRQWMLHNRVFLETGKNQRQTPARFETTQHENGGFGVLYRFEQVAPDASLSLVYEAPTLIISTPVSFEFTDVAAPSAK